MRLTARHYQRMLDLTIAVLDSHAVQDAWDQVVRGLVDAMSGEVGWMYEGIDLERKTGHARAWVPAEVARVPLASLLRTHMAGHPLARHLAETRDVTPLTVHDLVSESAWRASPAYSSLRSRFGVTRQIALAVACPGDPARTALTWRSSLISRSGRDFTAADRALARQLQPLLIRIDRHLSELQRLRSLAPATAGALRPEERAAAIGLTPRELSVLSLLATGLTASALARRLAISRHTATKHLENLYRKLGTSDRLTTVLLAQDIGLVPRGRPPHAAPSRPGPPPHGAPQHGPGSSQPAGLALDTGEEDSHPVGGGNGAGAAQR